jgi:hypothetical protein
MKVTKRQLKKIIKEEIEATMQEQGGDKMAKAQELAQVLAQSPAIMDFVREAAQNPEVQAVAEEGESKLSERHDPDVSQASALGAAGMGLGAAALHVNLMSQIGMVSAATAGGLFGALGLPAAGLIAVAVGILVHRTIKGPPVSER